VITTGMMSSKTGEWETPQDFFDALDAQYHFTLDPCATHENAKCHRYFTREDDGLVQSWWGERVFMNPPYGREISRWVAKAHEESIQGALVVCLLPARTDTRWFHDYCTKGRITFLRGRLKFGGSKDSAPFPSMVVVFGEKEGTRWRN
jgi:phage N-6-adenine-methyltransferase